MKHIEPIIFNLTFEINGKATDCGIWKRDNCGKGFYSVCANINGQSKEYHLHYDRGSQRYVF